jgi:hypothetical protein
MSMFGSEFVESNPISYLPQLRSSRSCNQPAESQKPDVCRDPVQNHFQQVQHGDILQTSRPSR